MYYVRILPIDTTEIPYGVTKSDSKKLIGVFFFKVVKHLIKLENVTDVDIDSMLLGITNTGSLDIYIF